MPSVGHLAVGLAGGRIARSAGRVGQAVWLTLLVGASYAPDLDVLTFRVGIPYGAPFGHRGAAHSIVVGSALGVAVGLLGWGAGIYLPAAVTTAVLVTVSHGLLDALTDGGKGIALLWPFSSERIFAGWRPIPVSPIGLRAFGPGGLAVMAREAVLFSPLFILGLWPGRRTPGKEVRSRQ